MTTETKNIFRTPLKWDMFDDDETPTNKRSDFVHQAQQHVSEDLGFLASLSIFGGDLEGAADSALLRIQQANQHLCDGGQSFLNEGRFLQDRVEAFENEVKSAVIDFSPLTPANFDKPLFLPASEGFEASMTKSEDGNEQKFQDEGTSPPLWKRVVAVPYEGIVLNTYVAVNELSLAVGKVLSVAWRISGELGGRYYSEETRLAAEKQDEQFLQMVGNLVENLPGRDMWNSIKVGEKQFWEGAVKPEKLEKAHDGLEDVAIGAVTGGVVALIKKTTSIAVTASKQIGARGALFTLQPDLIEPTRIKVNFKTHGLSYSEREAVEVIGNRSILHFDWSDPRKKLLYSVTERSADFNGVTSFLDLSNRHTLLQLNRRYDVKVLNTESIDQVYVTLANSPKSSVSNVLYYGHGNELGIAFPTFWNCRFTNTQAIEGLSDRVSMVLHSCCTGKFSYKSPILELKNSLDLLNQKAIIRAPTGMVYSRSISLPIISSVDHLFRPRFYFEGMNFTRKIATQAEIRHLKELLRIQVQNFAEREMPVFSSDLGFEQIGELREFWRKLIGE